MYDRPELLFADLDEKKYQPELALLDRYHAFSAELLRIALLGLAAFGFILKETFVKIDWAQAGLPLVVSKYLAVGSVALFGVCALCSLAHRYYSTEGVRFFFRALRLHMLMSDASAWNQLSDHDKSQQMRNRDQSLQERENALRWGPSLKGVAAGTLGVASFALAITVGILIWQVTAIVDK